MASKTRRPRPARWIFDGCLKDAPGLQNPQSQIDAGAGESDLPATILGLLHDALLGSVMFFFRFSSPGSSHTSHSDQEKLF
jgi:hypothetical protein